jgi:extracellular elastinolytic metalloproteinase
VRAHDDVFRLGAAALQALKLRRDYVDALGTHHLSWQMMVKGVPVFGNGLRANVTRSGRLLSVLGSPLATVPKLATAPRLTAARARGIAARDVGGRAAQATSRTAPGPRRTTTWSNHDAASLVVFRTPSAARLGWLTYVQAGGSLAYQHVIDAAGGRVLYRADLSADDNGENLVFDYYPGADAGGTQHLVNFVDNGWLTPAATKLFGRNAFVYSDLNDDNRAQNSEVIPAAKGDTPKWPLVTFSSSSLCDAGHLCTWDPFVTASWRDNRKQDGTQAFYFVNTWHDHLLAPPISFTPAAGNFELAGRDPVVVNTLDGANTARGMPDLNHVDNANMSTPPDGFPPLMQMFLFHAPGFNDTDDPFVPTSSSDEADIIYHEYTHGLSNRLVIDANGNTGLTAPQSRAMGEAWSDWYAFDYLVEAGLAPDTAADGEVLVGGYVAHGAPLIRFQPLDCPVGSAAPACAGGFTTGPGGFTYGDYGHVFSGPEVHSDGEIWGETLWDIRNALGPNVTQNLVTRGMELSPVAPSFLDMRNSILQADLVAYGGSHQDALWQLFAARGMGWFAGSFGGSDNHPAEDFSVPPPPGTPTATLTGTVTDADTGAPVEGATVSIAGHDSGFPGSYTSTTDASGAYSIPDVVTGTYPKVAMAAEGFELLQRPVTVTAGTTTQDFAPRRNWASGLAGGSIDSFNGPDFTPFGCGPSGAIDQSQATGWGSETGDGSPTNVMIPKFIVVKLPQAVDITSFEVDPSNTCGDRGSASTGQFRIETSPDGTTYTTAAEGTFTPTNRARFNVVTPTAGTIGVQYVKFWMLSPQVPDFATTCPDGPFAGCVFTDMTEIEVFGPPAS